MYIWKKGMILLCGLVICAGCRQREVQPKDQKNLKPNIIFILADDLGYGDLGSFGQELIETPNLDALARDGMRFTHHYSGAPVCAPSRYMILTGKHGGHAFIRGNDEWNERGPVWDYRAVAHDSTLEGQRPMPGNEVLLSDLMQKAGYRTGLFGKWGLGAPHTESIPTESGFDTFFGYNCQRQAHTYYPLHLYRDRNRVPLENDTIPPHSTFDIDKGNWGNDLFEHGDYAPFRIYSALEDFIGKSPDRPFFAYWATPIPHVPLQAPGNWVSYYRRKFGEEPGYVAGKGNGYFPHRYPRAAYAAMISFLDAQIGRLIETLKKKGLYENTLIVFTSDNGPSYAGGAQPEWFESGGLFPAEYGRAKGFLYEGGIRVPLIASWPEHIRPGTVSDLPTAQYDLLATFGAVAGFEPPDPADGISFLPTLLGSGLQQRHDFLLWAYPEYGGQLALRAGDWKLIWRGLNDTDRNPEPELYHLGEDPQERNNLAESYPERVDSLLRLFHKEYEVPEIPLFRLKEYESRFRAGH